ncbi:hypothetical protein H0H81_007775 [Sphagnurus paluster]|uniref:Dol-P-Man:Man(5)GlcNAc(2)-PP-Dol alpha-1,3-mannosyltransferase n=1 Tax=Sphagnurus paluster TaxID=117069 RepID=A0A9P7FT03_9AGAR|nr:hypothetical protein H0H81_007775 [Sphagnurus paluster]
MVKHLPPTIKHLLSLRNPNVLPGPPFTRLQGLLTRTLRDARLKNAETGCTGTPFSDESLQTCTLLSANRPASLGHLYRFVTRSDIHEPDSRVNVAHAVNKAALMRESALKSAIFVGVPRVILSLAALHEALDDDVKKTLRTKSRRLATSGTIESTIMRGQALWNSIYAPHADKLHDKLGVYHPDFISFIIQSYGSVLAPLPGGTKVFTDESSLDDPDQGNLSRAMGSIVGIATLRAEERVGPQLTSHTFGLLKARNIEGLSAEDSWLASDEGTEWVLRTVDEILDLLASEGQQEAETVGKVKL